MEETDLLRQQINEEKAQRKFAEIQLEKTASELLQARKLLNDLEAREKNFLADIGHEIRTALNAIIGMTNLLLGTRLEKEQLEYLTILNNSANILYDHICGYLDISLTDLPIIEFHKHPFDITDIFDNLRSIFLIRFQRTLKQLCTFIDPTISGIFIGDQVLLQRTLHSIITSIEEQIKQGKIYIYISAAAEKGGILWIDVRINAYNTEQEKPTKLNNLDIIYKNLSGIQEIVALQQGMADVNSEEIKFSIPLLKHNENEPDDSENTEKKYDVLIAEDNKVNHIYIRTLLDKWDMNSVIAVNGLKAVEFANEKVFDLILMDIQMPEMNGYDACQHIRNTSLNKFTPIIGLTASAMPEQKKQGILSGMNDIITKPFKPEIAMEIIRKYLPASQNNISTGISKPTLDYNRLKELYGDDPIYEADIMEAFLTETIPDFSLIAGFIKTKEWDTLSNHMHKLKPTLGMVGLTSLEEKFIQIESQIKQTTDSVVIISNWNKFEKELSASIPLLQLELETLQKNNSQ